MKYPDTVRLATTTPDGYGDRTVTILDEIPANFVRRKGMLHQNNADSETSDATVYLQHTHLLVLSKKDNLEGLYVQSEPFTDDTWYRITSVNISERKLLDNTIANIYCKLQKVAGLPYDIHIS